MCRDCATAQAFPRPFCANCDSRALECRESSGRGRIAAITTLHRAPTPEYRERVPYAIALVDLDEGFRIMAHAIPGLSAGDAVTARFHPIGERHLAIFDRGASDE